MVPLDFNNQTNGHLWTGSLPCCHSAFFLSLTYSAASAAALALHVSQAAPRPCCQPLLVVHPSRRKEPPWPTRKSLLSSASHQSPSTKTKPNLTRDPYLGQRNAEMRERKNIRWQISVPLPGFCSLSEIQVFTATAGCWLLICNLPPPHALPLRDPAYSSDSHTHAAASSKNWARRNAAILNQCLQSLRHVLLQRLVHLTLSPPRTITAGHSPDLTAWNLWIHDWDIQNGSQTTILHWECQDRCNSWDIPGVGFSVCLIEDRNDRERRRGSWGTFLTTESGIC